ncbi:MAG: TfuA-related McrA-glycine thioamidation protein [Methanimicrococcus sp.]|nr:TfuA-related McrA-glycine thioamidation protein [Methanimicrococcus sp.]
MPGSAPSSKVIVFLGPSLDLETARPLLPFADFRPPAARGDMQKAAMEDPDMICLIDGVFFEQCSVGHREILFALKKGIQVWGASSMGALRASETDTFGMVGFGKVYELYKTGIVESDDEVAVACDPFTNEAITDAFVNIRETIQKAISDSVLNPDDGNLLLETAKEMYYPDRTYDFLIEKIKKTDAINPDSIDRFEKWVFENAVDIKKEDAIGVLTLIFNRITDGKKKEE